MAEKNKTVAAKFEGVRESDLVSVKLAHPISSKQDKQRLGLPTDENYEVHDTVKVRQADAQTLINAGYAQVDPEDAEAVREVVGEPAAQPASTSGNKSSNDKSSNDKS